MSKAGCQGPQRSCIACRKVLDQTGLVRYVLSPQGFVLVDYGRKLPGRGCYTCCDVACLETAVQRKQFERIFKGRCVAPVADDLKRSLAGQIQQRVANLIGMARKSAAVLSGSRMVSQEMGRGADLALVVMSEDLSAAIADKVVKAAAARGISCHTMFDKGFMGQIIGKGERSVIALRAGPLAETIHNEILRYKQLAGEA